jgi:heme/copper-type cytochrome/quinol oxidase subunit 2
MDFVSNVLKNENGVQWFYTVGLLIFIVVFGIMVYKTWKMQKNEIQKYKNSIFENDND